VLKIASGDSNLVSLLCSTNIEVGTKRQNYWDSMGQILKLLRPVWQGGSYGVNPQKRNFEFFESTFFCMLECFLL